LLKIEKKKKKKKKKMKYHLSGGHFWDVKEIQGKTEGAMKTS